MCAHWEVCSCFLFESINFSTLIKLSWITLLLTPQIEEGMMRLSTLFLARAALSLCFPVLWYYLFLLLVFFFPPPPSQWIFIFLTWSCYILSITSLSSICFPPPTISPETLWSSAQIFPSPFSELPFLNVIFDRLFPFSMKWDLVAERHSSFTECAQVARDCLITKKLPISDR